jgi:hypothetical protein
MGRQEDRSRLATATPQDHGAPHVLAAPAFEKSAAASSAVSAIARRVRYALLPPTRAS